MEQPSSQSWMETSYVPEVTAMPVGCTNPCFGSLPVRSLPIDRALANRRHCDRAPSRAASGAAADAVVRVVTGRHLPCLGALL